MRNKAMQRKLESGQAISLSGYPQTPEGYYILDPSIATDIDYCDAERERWIWSIGRHRQTGRVLASLDSVFYQNPEFECLWLR